MANKTKARLMRGKFNSSRVKSRLIRKHGNICQSCGNYDPVIELDHIKPIWAGGSNDEDNLQLLCWNCHFAKTKRERKIYTRMNPQEVWVDGVWVNEEKCTKASKLKFDDLVLGA